MKKYVLALLISVATSLAANAADDIGQCVMPKTNIAKNGNLVFKKPVFIFDAPGVSGGGIRLTDFSSYTIKAEARGYIQLAIADFDSPDHGKIIGWAKLSDFEFQALRNC
jgi:hypothetical protein